MKRKLVKLIATSLVLATMSVNAYAENIGNTAGTTGVTGANGVSGTTGAGGAAGLGAVGGANGQAGMGGTAGVGGQTGVSTTGQTNVNQASPNVANPASPNAQNTQNTRQTPARQNTPATRTAPQVSPRSRVNPQDAQNRVNNAMDQATANAKALNIDINNPSVADNTKIGPDTYLVQDGADLWIVSGKYKAKLDVLIYSDNELTSQNIAEYKDAAAAQNEVANGEETNSTIPVLK